MATHRLVIEKWAPTPINSYQGRHWSAKHAAKKADREVVFYEARKAKTPLAHGRRKVDVLVTWAGRGRIADPDNLLKGLLDACVCAGLLVDDSFNLCVIGRVEVVRGKQKCTVVELTDLDTEATCSA